MGKRFGSISTTLTLVPSWASNPANSEPITPPPIIVSDCGIDLGYINSSEEIIVLPLKENAGIFSGREPVATIILSASITLVVPSCISTASLLLLSKYPKPLYIVTPYDLNKKPIPATNSFTTLFFRSTMRAKLICGSPGMSIPNSAASLILRYRCAEAMKVLVGTQPQFRQIPPSLSSSIQATLAPSCAALIAATYPPGPPPNIAISYFSAILVPLNKATHNSISIRPEWLFR